MTSNHFSDVLEERQALEATIMLIDFGRGLTSRQTHLRHDPSDHRAVLQDAPVEVHRELPQPDVVHYAPTRVLLVRIIRHESSLNQLLPIRLMISVVDLIPTCGS